MWKREAGESVMDELRRFGLRKIIARDEENGKKKLREGVRYNRKNEWMRCSIHGE